MSKRRLTEEQLKELSSNVNVVRCSAKSITYTKEFKLLAIKQYNDGWSAIMIFKEAGFDPHLFREDMPRGCLTRWRRKYRRKGDIGLINDERGRSHKSGRPKTKGLTDTDRIKRLEIENAYLKAENDFLAKLRAAQKR